jgi:hypothetical protein
MFNISPKLRFGGLPAQIHLTIHPPYEFDHNTAQKVDFTPKFACSYHSGIRAYLKPDHFAGLSVEQSEQVWGDYKLCFPIINVHLNMVEHDQSMAVAA